jgi:hypothetical protein
MASGASHYELDDEATAVERWTHMPSADDYHPIERPGVGYGRCGQGRGIRGNDPWNRIGRCSLWFHGKMEVWLFLQIRFRVHVCFHHCVADVRCLII